MAAQRIAAPRRIFDQDGRAGGDLGELAQVKGGALIVEVYAGNLERDAAAARAQELSGSRQKFSRLREATEVDRHATLNADHETERLVLAGRFGQLEGVLAERIGARGPAGSREAREVRLVAEPARGVQRRAGVERQREVAGVHVDHDEGIGAGRALNHGPESLERARSVGCFRERFGSQRKPAQREPGAREQRSQKADAGRGWQAQADRRQHFREQDPSLVDVACRHQVIRRFPF